MSNENQDQDTAERLVRRAVQADDQDERDALLRRTARFVGSAEQRRLWRKYSEEE